MSPKKADEPRSEQLLLRLTAAETEVLESIAHLEGVTPNAYAYRLLTSHLARLRTQPHVRADITNRRAYAEQQAATAPLPGRTVGDEKEPADVVALDTPSSGA